LGAEFVNVTGLWWHDRASIRKAHAYGLARIFNASTLTIDALRVKQPSDDVAIVHAAMTLTGQTAASAHNTDAVPNMETNVIAEDGAFRAVNYRTGQMT
jgi:hypothetical protein